jgi:hypothetical protein
MALQQPAQPQGLVGEVFSRPDTPGHASRLISGPRDRCPVALDGPGEWRSTEWAAEGFFPYHNRRALYTAEYYYSSPLPW